MTDPHSGRTEEEPQTAAINYELEGRKRFQPEEEVEEKTEESKKQKKEVRSPVVLFREGKEALEAFQYSVEFDLGHECGVRILKRGRAPEVKGINYPAGFYPHLDLNHIKDLTEIERVLVHQCVKSDVLEFWMPIYRPGSVPNPPITTLAERMVKYEAKAKAFAGDMEENFYATFDPEGTFTGAEPQTNPRLWVPAHEWFPERLREELKFEDVFTLFPEAEARILELIIGRMGVGRKGSVPLGFDKPLDHTFRSAAVIVGKQAGVGKSTLFDGLSEAIARVGMRTETFRSTDDRFGLGAVASADLAIKDDTAIKQLKLFLEAENTKILVTNGLFQAEEKFQSSIQLRPRCVLIVNSNAWENHFAYGLDPGIIDRIKPLITLGEYELEQKRLALTPESASYGTPSLLPEKHLKFLAEKYDVDKEALFLWCLRLATDRFWEVINIEDEADNPLKKEIHYWTSRLEIKFKDTATAALTNAMVMASAVRRDPEKFDIPELSPSSLLMHLKDLYFCMTDKSAKDLMSAMKKHWDSDGRSRVSFYQGMKDVRPETLARAIEAATELEHHRRRSFNETIKEVFSQIGMRDGFQISTGISYITENFVVARREVGKVRELAEEFRSGISETQRDRLSTLDLSPDDDWINNPSYSPNRAEEMRPGMD